MTNATTAAGTNVHTRWMVRRDWHGVKACGLEGWTHARYLRHLRQRNVIGMVAEAGGRVVGWFLYRLGPTYVRLLALAVHPEYRRQGVASALLAKLRGKLATHRRPVGVATVAEGDLPAQLALRSAGWTCERVLRGRFGEQDGYRFTLSLGVRWRTRGGVSVSRCGRWRVWKDGGRWNVADLAGRATYRQGWLTAEAAREWAERCEVAD